VTQPAPPSRPWTGGPVGERARCVLAPNPGPMTLDGTNTWLLAEPGADRAVVVDPGPDDEGHLRADQTSPFASFLPARGLELVRVTYDAYSDVDTDGDGDPHTVHVNDLIPRANATLPEAGELELALQHCTKQLVCSSDEHDFKLTLKNGLLTRLEIIDRVPCQAP